MPEGRECVICSKPFKLRSGRPKQRFCSLKCAGRDKVLEPPTFICIGCGAVKERRRFRKKNGQMLGFDYTTLFCSRECGWKNRRKRPINPDGHINQGTGYIRVNLRGGGHAYKHRQVMEEMLGRPLQHGESPHHRNGQRTDNRPDNLELWSKKQPPGQRVIDKVEFALEMLRLYPEFIVAAGGTEMEHAPFSIRP